MACSERRIRPAGAAPLIVAGVAEIDGVLEVRWME